ncbi:MAG: hypothetical protein GX316_01890 [Firmicutes bacterium]|nr:hypothetical protein [Bacillota bacterium]
MALIEKQLNKRFSYIAGATALIAVFAALFVVCNVGSNYYKYLKWTQNTHTTLISAAVENQQSQKEITLKLELQSPDVGYAAEIESLEFAIKERSVTLGYYRIIISDRVPIDISPDGNASFLVSTVLVEEDWPLLAQSVEPQVEGQLIVRLYLPGKEVPTRIPVHGALTVRGDAL